MVLREGTQRETKKDAFSNNVAAALAIAEAVKSTLGPKGLDKLLIDGLGDLTITNDGATILKEIDVDHPTAKMMVSVAETQDDEVGDGTTSSVIICGNILNNISELVQAGVHPSIVAKGISYARKKALEVLDEISQTLTLDDRDLILKVVSTSMNSKLISLGKERLSELALDAMLTLKKAGVENLKRNVDKVKIIKKEGGDALSDTVLVKGIILDKEIVHSSMARSIKDPVIALLGFPLEVKKGEWDAKITIDTPDQINTFLDEEDRMVKEKVDKLKNAGVTVVLSQKSMDDAAIHHLKDAGIVAVKGIGESDLKKIKDAVHGSIINSLDDLSSADFGKCGAIYEKKLGNSKYLFIDKCENPKAISLLIRGEGAKGLDEVERGLHDSLCIAAKIIQEPAIVGGGGAVEVELSKQLLAFAKSFSGREQLVIEHVARALESIPMTLAENAGLDAIEVVSGIRAAHVGASDYFKGFNLYTGKVEDMRDSGIVEPVSLIRTAIKTATEAAIMVVRIDDVIRAGKLGA
ncbi:MAG: thermosome subunit beta [Promethearchaeota archaeon]